MKFPSSAAQEIPNSFPDNPWLDDAYCAESLLGVCAILVKSTSFFALPNWEGYFFTFLLYLSHPASTVRQECSSIFRHILAKNSQANVVKLILQSLIADWEPFLESSIVDSLWGHETAAKTIRFPISPTINQRFTTRWEWKEGRLLALELVLKFLINNHIHYIFPFSPRRGTAPSSQSSPVDKVPVPQNFMVLRRSISAQEIGTHISPLSLITPTKVNSGPVSLIDQISSLESGSNLPQKALFTERLHNSKVLSKFALFIHLDDEYFSNTSKNTDSSS